MIDIRQKATLLQASQRTKNPSVLVSVTEALIILLPEQGLPCRMIYKAEPDQLKMPACSPRRNVGNGSILTCPCRRSVLVATWFWLTVKAAD